jgi:hypothetical protein
MNAAEEWLRVRVPNAPAHLLKAMIGALRDEGNASVPNTLAAAAVRLYSQVVEGEGGREDALPLLAADALLTHAFQAQAELDPTSLAEFADRWSARGKLGQVLL